MIKLKVKVAAVLALILFGTHSIFGQHAGPVQNVPGTGRAQGSLTVTLTVVSSVGVVTGADGQQRVVVANAAAASDNVSTLQYVPLTDANASGVSASHATAQAGRKSHRK